jgi:hypothetical protein
LTHWPFSFSCSFESFLGDQNIEVEDDVLHINTAGRPSKDMEKVKKSLAFTNGLAEVWKKKRSLNQYKLSSYSFCSLPDSRT